MPNSTITKLEELCKENNIKMTEQRKVVAEIIDTSVDHPDIEAVYDRAKAKDEKISIATVYRTMNLLEEAGIVEKHDFGNGKARYEVTSDDHHDHLIDVKSGEIIEFFNQELENLKSAIAKKHGYKLIDHRLELYAVPLKKHGK
jgi:Fur family ferric uptake transcriptional regulator